MLEVVSSYLPFIVAALSVVTAVLLILVIHLALRLKGFMRGKDAMSLEDVIKHMLKEHAHMMESDKILTKASDKLNTTLKDVIRGVSLVRFNALSGDSSGKQSFAIALLSESGKGVVVSSLYTRDSARVYAKPIKNFASEHELTEEEKRAIVEARKHL